MSNSIANTVTTNILPVQALYDPTTLAFITFIGPAGTPFTGTGGGVSSVNVSGGTTGLTTSGGPIVSSGTITIAGTLNVANGGTGSTTANGALTNLLPSQTGNSGKFLTTDGTNTSWSTAGSGLTISTDTTTNASRYLTFTATTSGVITSENVSTSLYFNPSSGSLTSTTFVGALTGNASTATSATTSTNLAGGANGSLPYQTGSGTTTFLAAGSNGQFLTLSGGVPTWSNLTYVSSFSAGTTGFTPSVSTTGAVTLSGTLNVANGGTGVTSSSGANSVVLRDANQNVYANNFIPNTTFTTASATPINLTVSSAQYQVVTGSTQSQQFNLPDATTLTVGDTFYFNNNITYSSVQINAHDGTTSQLALQAGGAAHLILLTNSTTNGTWDVHSYVPSTVSWGTATLSFNNSSSISGTVSWQGNAVGPTYGGTGQTSYTTGDTLYASASNTLSKLAIGSTGQVLTVAGGVPTWANTTAATTITDDTTTNATRYINFTSATSGSLSTIYTSSTKLQYNPSTGAFTAPTLTPTNALGTAYGGTGLTSFTANGVVYASSTSALATGSALTFNGTNLALGSSPTSYQFEITTSGNNGLKINAGTAGADQLFLGDTGGSPAVGTLSSSPLTFIYGGSEKMRLTSTGLGIGTSSPGRALELYNSSAAMKFNNGTYNWTIGTGSFIDGSDSFNILSGTLGGVALRVDSSGNLLVGTTSQLASALTTISTSTARYGLAVACTTSNLGNGVAYFQKYDNNSTTSNVFVAFAMNNGSNGQGQINGNGAAQAAFGAYSDSRLKENIVDLPSQLKNVMALRPVEFDYIESEGGGHQIGFVAQEMQTVYPDSIGQRADGMLTVTGWNKTEARLVKAIQELNAEIQSLKAEVATLKGA